MDRLWFVTWTTFGTWLPGDERGSVGRQRPDNDDNRRELANKFQTESHSANRGLARDMAERLSRPEVYLSFEQAKLLNQQFQETCRHRNWLLIATAILSNHVHLIVGVAGDPEPGDLLRDFKAYGSRALNRCSPAHPSRKWWTEHGSTRKLPDQVALAHAVRYVREQDAPLLLWSNDTWLRKRLSTRSIPE